MRMGISGLDSVKKCKSDLQRFLRQVDTVQEQELDTLATEMLAEMQRRTPYESGKLESGVYCRRSRGKGTKGIVAGATAMNGDYNYAVVQHENESFEHPVKGEAHFVSGPFEEGVAKFMDTIERRLKL